MIKLADLLNEVKNIPKPEVFSAYHGRYKFDVTKAYSMIQSGKVKAVEQLVEPQIMGQWSHSSFSLVDPKKLKSIELDYSRPLGLAVKFQDPESGKSEWILIDGNHRVRKASKGKKKGLILMVSNPDDVTKFMTTDVSKPHKLFQDDDE